MRKRKKAIRNIAVSKEVHRTIRTLAYKMDIKMYQALELIISGQVSASETYERLKK